MSGKAFYFLFLGLFGGFLGFLNYRDGDHGIAALLWTVSAACIIWSIVRDGVDDSK